jgi:hypothetical protein
MAGNTAHNSRTAADSCGRGSIMSKASVELLLPLPLQRTWVMPAWVLTQELSLLDVMYLRRGAQRMQQRAQVVSPPVEAGTVG